MKSMAGYDHYGENVSSPCSPLRCYCRTNIGDIIHRLPNEVINTHSKVVVSGCPMKGMARYDHHGEIVSSPCSPVSCHCRTIMVEILPTNEIINSYSEVECRYILLSVVVSGCPMKDKARYDHYEEIVSSPRPPFRFHWCSNMVETFSTAIFRGSYLLSKWSRVQ